MKEKSHVCKIKRKQRKLMKHKEERKKEEKLKKK